MKVGNKYKYAVIATDVVIFTVKDGLLSVLLMKMDKKPYLNHWAVPGGLIKSNESADQAASRELAERTGLKNIYLEQLYTFGEVGRDPFGRVVSVAYFALIPFDKNLKINDGVQWFPVKVLPAMAYDHKKIVTAAVERLKSKLAYSNIVFGLLPEKFTLGELQGIYETILEKKLDKRNFRKKINSLKLVRKAGGQKRGLPRRPADLYSFTSRKPQIVGIL